MKVKSKVWAGLRKKIGDPARPDDVDTLRRMRARQAARTRILQPRRHHHHLVPILQIHPWRRHHHHPVLSLQLHPCLHPAAAHASSRCMSQCTSIRSARPATTTARATSTVALCIQYAASSAWLLPTTSTPWWDLDTAGGPFASLHRRRHLGGGQLARQWGPGPSNHTMTQRSYPDSGLAVSSAGH